MFENQTEVSEILVSVICTAYNHEDYIEQALQGFVSQKTNFNYEVIIHDDASTDKTAAVIKKYAKQYPKIIIPIYQKENQHSKGVRITRTILLPRARGKYIALCEGDDYWIDPDKLQKQVEIMESNQGCTFCFTNAIVDYNKGPSGRKKYVIPWNEYTASVIDESKTVYYLDDLVHLLSYIPTASFMTLREDYQEMPTLPKGCFQGDQYIALYCTHKGYAYFLNEPTCAYRRNVPGSATVRWSEMEYDKDKLHPVHASFLALYDEFDLLTDEKYTESLNILRAMNYISYAFSSHDYSFFERREVKDYIKKSGFRVRVKYLLLRYPWIEKKVYHVLYQFRKIRHGKN